LSFGRCEENNFGRALLRLGSDQHSFAAREDSLSSTASVKFTATECETRAPFGSVCDDQGDIRSLGAAQDRQAKGDGLGGVARNIAHKIKKAVPAREPPLVVNCGAS
jgi:hypothetical protein